jgi:hypothetical protein
MDFCNISTSPVCILKKNNKKQLKILKAVTLVITVVSPLIRPLFLSMMKQWPYKKEGLSWKSINAY